MEALELNIKHVKVLLGKAYEWRAKTNRRHNRIDYFKTKKAIRRFKKFKKYHEGAFLPNKNEILLTLIWFERCPARTDDEKLIFILVSLIYKLHKSELSNIQSKT